MAHFTVSASLFTSLLAGAAVFSSNSAPALAGAPVAIVEDVAGGKAGVGFMEYLEAGRKIELGEGGRIVIGYLRSCLRETVTGGTLTVGQKQSRITGGKIQRERVECDGGQIRLTEAQADKSGVVVMRQAPRGSGSAGYASPAADFRIFSTRPLITLTETGVTVVITRLDKPAAEIVIGTTGTFVDLSEAKDGLAIGGLYRARAGGRSVVFSVDAFATDGSGKQAGPAISRLIPL